MSDNVVVITHGEDVDGIASAAILGKVLRENTEKQVIYRFANYNNLGFILEEVRKFLGVFSAEVFVTDLGVPDHLLEESEGGSLIGEIVGASDGVVWIDHHRGTDEWEKRLRRDGVRVIKEEGVCASKLVYREYGKDDLISYYLSRLAQANDYPEDHFEPAERSFGLVLQDLIFSFNYFYESPEEQLEMLTEDLKYFPFLFSQEFEHSGVYLEALKRHERRLEDATCFSRNTFRTIFLKEKGEDRVKLLLGYCPGVLPPKVITFRTFMEYRDKGLDGVMLLFGSPVNNALFFAYPGSSLDAVEFCRFMGGGGREDAGGFSVEEGIDERNFSYWTEYIIQKIKEFLGS